MNDYNSILISCRAYHCVECGKCVAMCPMSETSPDFSQLNSPRGIIRQVLNGVSPEDIQGVLSCVQCGSCSRTCPEGVDVARLVAQFRETIPELCIPRCRLCGEVLLPPDAAKYLKKAIDAGYEAELEYSSLCPSCKRKVYARNNS